MRRRLRELIAYFGGKVVHPVLGLARRRQQGPQSRGPAQVQGTGQGRPRVRPLDAGRLQEDRPGEPGLREDDHLATPITHKTCYMGMVDEQNKVNFYDGKIRVVDCNGKEVCKFTAQQYPRLRGRARRAVELHEVHLPEAARLEGLRRRPGHQHLLGGAAGAPERRRRHGHAQGPGRLRGVLQDPRRQTGPPHPGQPLGARHRDDLCRRAHGAACQRSRDHQPGRAARPDQRAQGRHRRRRSPARHALPSLRDRREGPDQHGQHDRGHRQQRRPHRHERRDARPRASSKAARSPKAC